VKQYSADLHIHTCLSPCADWEMSPVRIVRKATEMGLHIIAICDHNSAKNVSAVKKAALSHNLTIIPGMEVWSREEAHILTLFKTNDDAQIMQEKIYAGMTQKNNPDIFGYQIIADHQDLVLGEEDLMLIGSCGYSIQEISDMTDGLGGICIASHVDRPSFSIIRQLGFIPPTLKLHGIEISNRSNYPQLQKKNPEINDYPVVFSSDAHYLKDIGKQMTQFTLEKPDFNEIKLALQNLKGRKINLSE